MPLDIAQVLFTIRRFTKPYRNQLIDLLVFNRTYHNYIKVKSKNPEAMVTIRSHIIV